MGKSQCYGEYLDKKYASIEDKPIDGKSSKKKPMKKSNHKHSYKNCIVSWEEKYPLLRNGDHSPRTVYALRSYCTCCGKIGEFDKTDPIYEQLINKASEFQSNSYTVVRFLFGTLPASVIDDAKKVYQVFKIKDILTDKFVGLSE